MGSSGLSWKDQTSRRDRDYQHSALRLRAISVLLARWAL